MLPSKGLLFSFKPNLFKQLILVAPYSRKSNLKNLSYYKLIKSNDAVDDGVEGRLGAVANWELLAPKGHRFMMPGFIGPAWHEPGSMVPIDSFQRFGPKLNKVILEEMECTAQECPILLRKGVLELFSNSDVYASQQLTVVTLFKKKKQHRSKNPESDLEEFAKMFILAAQEICIKLKTTGYWADFINPFSGRPYLSSYHKPTLYETDERFRCIGFEINKKGDCKIIQSQKYKHFTGSLFTNAPPNMELLYNTLKEI